MTHASAIKDVRLVTTHYCRNNQYDSLTLSYAEAHMLTVSGNGFHRIF